MRKGPWLGYAAAVPHAGLQPAKGSVAVLTVRYQPERKRDGCRGSSASQRGICQGAGQAEPLERGARQGWQHGTAARRRARAVPKGATLAQRGSVQLPRAALPASQGDIQMGNKRLWSGHCCLGQSNMPSSWQSQEGSLHHLDHKKTQTGFCCIPPSCSLSWEVLRRPSQPHWG